MLLLHVYYKAKDSEVLTNFFEELDESGAPEITRKEKGCIRYDYFVSTTNATKALLVEQWETPEDQEAHSRQPHFKTIGEIKAKYGLETEVEKFLV